MNRLSFTVAVAVTAVSIAAVGAYSGALNVAADSPHWNASSRVITFVRNRSIAVRADSLTVPDLSDRDLIAMGAEHYSEMCTDCHLAPGIMNTELRQGLYPVPPDLSAGTSLRPAEAFWVIKHGVKMSAMPAWGGTHDDSTIWAIVAFLQKLPTLDAKDYAALAEAQDTADFDHAADEPGETTMKQASAVEHVHTHPAGNEHRAD